MELGKELIVKIVRFNNEGEGVAIFNDLVIFVKGALIDEEVQIKIVEIKKNYAIGKLINVLIPSEERREPICPYYTKCGGCDIMHMSEKLQLEFKKKKIEDVFKKVCKLDIKVKDICAYNNLNYRNKVTLRVEKDKIGYYKSKSNELVDIEECKICNEGINDVIKVLREYISHYKTHKITEVVIRNARDEIMIYFKTLNPTWQDKFIERVKNVTSIYVKDKLIYGIDSINQKVNDLVFDISPKSFFQINIETASNLYRYALKRVENQNITVDLYSGTGTIAMELAKKSRRVIAIESNKSAVANAKNNMGLNDIDNVEFKLGRVEDLIDELKEINIDTLVLDPPRTGSDKKSLRALLKIKPKNIVYISCNPVTLARDYNVIRNLYNIVEIKAFDMFPNTHHIESLLVLEKKDV